jgi:hypothetical protein
MLVLGISFSACKKKTSKRWNVKNNTDGQINVYSVSFRNEVSNQPVQPGYSYTFMIYPDDGRNAKVENPGEKVIQLVIKKAGAACLKDYKDSTKWVTVISNTKNTSADYQHDYTFEVGNTDF